MRSDVDLGSIPSRPQAIPIRKCRRADPALSTDYGMTASGRDFGERD